MSIALVSILNFTQVTHILRWARPLKPYNLYYPNCSRQRSEMAVWKPYVGRAAQLRQCLVMMDYA